jgi:HAE1 family hydrophobic/amphiphilic exporter-1
LKVNPIIRFAVERRVTMTMAVLGVLVLGWLSLQRLPLEFLPTFSSSYVSVSAPYPSSSPAETERLIVRPLEDSLSTINGIDSLTAVSNPDSGNVSLLFVDGTDMDLAVVDVRDRVDRVRHRLPADLERVRIRRFQSSDRPVMRFHLSADWPRERLYRFTEDVIVRRLQRLEGVADVQVRGDETREVQVNLIPDRMAALGIDVRDVSSVIRNNHMSVSAGTVRDGSRSYQFRVEGKLDNLDEIGHLPLGGGLRLGDVATIEMAYPEQDEWDFLNGQEALSVRLYKASNANLLAMIEGAKKEIAAIQELPDAEGLQINIYRDDSEDVRNGLEELRNTGLLGGLLAVLFMYLFLRRFRSTLLVAIAIPVSIVVTFVFMYLSRQAGWSDLTLNILTLMGLMLSIGMLVDNSIVVIESIFRHHEDLGEDARRPADRRFDHDYCLCLPADGLPGVGRPSCIFHGEHRAHGRRRHGGFAGGRDHRGADGGVPPARWGTRTLQGAVVAVDGHLFDFAPLHVAPPARLQRRGDSRVGRLVEPLSEHRAHLHNQVVRTEHHHIRRLPEELHGGPETRALRRRLYAARRAT